MDSTPAKSKKPRTKTPRGRPTATSSISQPALQDASSLSSFSLFSPYGDLFAFLSLAIDKHRLRVYDTVTGQAVAEYLVEDARVTSLAWARFDSAHGHLVADGEERSPRKKRKKGGASELTESSPSLQVVGIGLSDGSVLLFSSSHGRVIRTLSHPTSSAAVVFVAAEESERGTTIWTSSSDGVIRLWDALKGTLLGTWKSDDRIPYTALALRPTTEKDRSDILAAHHSIHLLSVPATTQTPEAQKPSERATFTGHASSIKSLRWDTPSRFLSSAEVDRFVNVWEVPSTSSGSSVAEGKMIASIPLDTDVRSIVLAASSHDLEHQQTLLALSASGKIFVFPLPADISPDTTGKKTKIPTLDPKSVITPTNKGAKTADVAAAVFVQGEEGRIRIARLAGGIKPIFDVVSFLDESGQFIPEVSISQIDPALAAQPEGTVGVSTMRYKETPSLALGSGMELGQDISMDDLPTRDVDGDLDVDLAELSLGQRLTALAGGQNPDSASDAESDTAAQSSKRERDVPAVPAGSLARTLIQALHSSDARLLETCLAHSDAGLIRNTVRMLPSQLAVPLVVACVERLGRGARAGQGKGGGGGASAQRGNALVAWVRAVLIAHSGHLMTMPDLVARLAGLHATLTTRLTLQESLLSLSGRLDMVLSQIEMRASAAPAPLPFPKGKNKHSAGGSKKREVKRYVEGESEDEAPAGMDVEVESGDEDGSVEDVELGVDDDNSSEEEEEDNEEDEDDDDDDDEEGPRLNGFIDDEAEESEDDDDNESE